MNVNLTPSVETSKVTNVTKSASSQDLVSGESGESKGFLDRLASLLLGKNDASTSTGDSSVAKDGKSVENSEVKATSTDELLSQSDEGEDSSVKAESDADISSKAKLVAEEESVEIPDTLKRFVASEEPEHAELKAKTAKAMDDGDKILGRLQEANQTLVKTDGKALPHEKESDLPVKPIKAEKAQVGKEISSDDELPQEKVAHLNVSQQSQVKPMHSEQQKLALEQESPQQDKAQLQPQLLNQSALNQSSESIDPLTASVKNAKDLQALSESEQAAILAKQPKFTEASAQSQDASQEALASMTPAAIPWGNANAEKAAVMGESLVAEANNAVNSLDGKVQPKAAAHVATSQQLPQGAQVPQATLNQADKAMLAQSQLPQHAEAQAQLQQVTNAQANPMLAGSMANQIDPMVNQAALKAGIGAKALSSLMDGNKRTEGSADAHLAQQLSAAAGQQGLNGPQALRSEPLQAAQQNMPLQLSRGDMAAEQMAERVQVMLSKNLKNIDIRLDPPELGRMHIRMNMNGDGATVHFTVANQQARDALEQSIPRLREMLNNQGVQLGDTSVQQQSSGQQQRYAASGDGSGGQSASGDQRQSEENLDTNVKLDLNVAAKRDGISYYA